jgi:hypothetical protein
MVPYASLCCNVPVYQYALERWEAGMYEILAFYDGSMAKEQQEAIALLESHSYNSEHGYNFIVKTLDANETGSKPSKSDTYIEVFFPGGDDANVAWKGDFTPENARRILESPIRSAIARNILRGDTAVWVFLKGRDSDMAESSLETLQDELSHIESTMKPVIIDDGQPTPKNFNEITSVSFSIVVLSRDDPEEEVLVSMLINSEPDLDQFEDEPMAFPVYARGRVAYALVGKGITPKNIQEAMEFITGACSCVVKDTNPGTDLLLPINWEKELENYERVAIETRSLTGLGEVARAVEGDNIPTPTPISTPISVSPAPSSPVAVQKTYTFPLRILLIAAFIFFIVLYLMLRPGDSS